MTDPPLPMPRLNLNLKNNILASDTEATGINPYGDIKRWGFEPARPFAFSFCDYEGNTDYIRWEVEPKTRKVIVNSTDLKILKDLYADPSLTHVGHNFTYDIRMMKFTGIEIKGTIEDTLILAHIVTGGRELSYALKPLAKKYLQFSDEDEKELQEATKHARLEGRKLGWCIANKEQFGKEPIKADYWMAPAELCKKYAVRDSIRAMLFYRLWKDCLTENLRKVYEREMKLTYVVRKMEERGVKVFTEDLDRLRKFYEGYMQDQIDLADKNGGKGLNFRSHKQMTNKFYVEKKCEVKKHTPSGNPKLDGEILAELAGKDPLAKAILEFRGAGHMLSAFLNVYEKFRVQDEKGDWVLHPSYRQCGPVTGRFSCGDPNLMQVASETTGRRKTEITLRPREAFGPREGYLWYLPDYCLHPDTLVKTVYGDKKISEIKKGEKVLTFKDRKISYGEVTKTLKVKPLPSYKLTFDNGESVIASSDHRWPVQIRKSRYDRSKIEEKTTEELKVGESMVPCKKVGGKGKYVNLYSVDGALSYTSETKLIAEAVYGLRPKGYDIHHKDGNKSNNHPSNLEYLPSSLHRSFHSKKNYKVQDHVYRLEKLRVGITNRRSYVGSGNSMWGKKHTEESKRKNSEKKKIWWKNHPEARQSLAKRNSLRKLTNHKLVSIKYVGLQPMHAITVEPDHNYVLSCGVVTSNCQIEVWVFAFLAQDQAMMNALLGGHDFHSWIAEFVWGTAFDFKDRKSYYRKRAKLLMFCKLYGGGTKKVAFLMECTVPEAEKFVAEYDVKLPGVQKFMRRMINRACREGKVTNVYGREYYMEEKFAYRSVNYLVQGTCADIMKQAMLNVNNLFETKWKGCHLLLTLHDELVIEVPYNLHSKALMRDIVKAMQGEFHKNIGSSKPLPVSVKVATKRWSSTTEISL